LRGERLAAGQARHVLLHRGMETGIAQERPLGPGTVVGPCVLDEPIGVGGMGIVYGARLGGAEVAIKLLHREWLGDHFVVERFRDEATAGLAVQHPNVAMALERGETADGTPYLVMERVRGEPLGLWLERDGALSPRRAAAIVGQILDGLGAIHRAGVVHGDVKADNILIEARGDGTDSVKLIDFGLAEVDLGGEPAPLEDELVAGTPDYMAPEVIRGRRPRPASDLYAAGVLLYELVTGVTPFGGAESPSEVLRRHLEEEAVPPSLRAAGWPIPAALDRIVLRALAKEPRSRFAGAAAFAAELAAVAAALDGGERSGEAAPARRRAAAGTPGYDAMPTRRG
jgi:serine/threonine-protein kinase